MKFTGFAVSLALAGVVSSAAVPSIPGTDGALGGLEGAAAGTPSGIGAPGLKREVGDGLGGATGGLSSSLNGITGIAGSAVGTGESISSGAAGTVEGTVAGLVPAAKRQDLSGVAGTVGSTVDNAVDSSVGTAVGNTVPGLGAGTVGSVSHTAGNIVPEVASEVGSVTGGIARRQLGGAGNIVQSSLTNDLALLTGNPSALIGALGQLQGALSQGDITQGQISGLPAQLQHVVALIYTA